MFDKEKERKEKLEKLIKLTNTSDEDLAKMNFKEKQAVFKAKNSLCKIVFVSRDKNGKGLTYRKPKKKVVE